MVVLPAPLGPRNPVIRPGSTMKLRLRTATTPLYALTSRSITIGATGWPTVRAALSQRRCSSVRRCGEPRPVAARRPGAGRGEAATGRGRRARVGGRPGRRSPGVDAWSDSGRRGGLGRGAGVGWPAGLDGCTAGARRTAGGCAAGGDWVAVRSLRRPVASGRSRPRSTGRRGRSGAVRWSAAGTTPRCGGRRRRGGGRVAGPRGGGPAVIGAYGRTGTGGRGGRVVDPLRVGGGPTAAGWAAGGEDARPDGRGSAGGPGSRRSRGGGATEPAVGDDSGPVGAGRRCDRRQRCGPAAASARARAGCRRDATAGCGAGVGGGVHPGPGPPRHRDRRRLLVLVRLVVVVGALGSTSARAGRRGGAGGPASGLECRCGRLSAPARAGDRAARLAVPRHDRLLLGRPRPPRPARPAPAGGQRSATGAAAARRPRTSARAGVPRPAPAACGTGAGTNPLDRRGTYADDRVGVLGFALERPPRSCHERQSFRRGARRLRDVTPSTLSAPGATQQSGSPAVIDGRTVDVSAPSTTHERISLPCRPCTAPATTG